MITQKLRSKYADRILGRPERLKGYIRTAEETAVKAFGRENVEVLPFGVCPTEFSSCKDFIMNRLDDGLIGEPFDVDSLYKQYINPEIVVRFPEVVVTNENNTTVVIYDLFVKINLRNFSIKYIRSTYTRNQFLSGYLHSHAPSMVYPQNWSSVCLGTGPIKDTIQKLKKSVEDKAVLDNFRDIFPLFWWELQKITEVESLDGVPYRRLENIGKNLTPPILNINFSKFSEKIMEKFMISYLKTDRFKVVYRDNAYRLAVPFFEWWVDLSEYMIRWISGACLNNASRLTNLFIDYVVKDNKIRFSPTINSRMRYLNDGNLPIIIFKGNVFKLKILDIEEPIRTVKLLDINNASTILYVLLQTLNQGYGKETKARIREEDYPETNDGYNTLRQARYHNAGRAYRNPGLL